VLRCHQYDGYKAIEVMPETTDQVHQLHKLSSVLGFELDFWKDTGRVGRSATVMVAPQHESALLAAFTAIGLKPKIVVENVATLIDREREEMKAYGPAFGPKDDTDIVLTQYHTYADIMTYVQAVAVKYNSFVTLGSLGMSLENRNMPYLKLGTPRPGVTKPALFIDAGLHAREWITEAVAIWTIDQLTRNYATYSTLLGTIDIYIVPCLNPDGYEWSRTNTRLWRKNRRLPSGGNCYGVDLNRNFEFKWGVSGTSNDHCSEVYLGPSPNSEPETRNLKAFLDANAANIKAYVTLHSYSQDFLVPWGYAVNTYPPDFAELMALANQAAAALTAVHGTRYVVEQSAGLYPASGASDDYAKSIDIKYVYTVELRPTGDPPGFQLPANQIVPTSEETFAAIRVIANQVATM